jgi:2-polyprenyl-6-methoxyphenol hydroxylase-like FAD-dependent oxidoreductase
MYPRGSNGSAQGLIDARTLAEVIEQDPNDLIGALKRYEAIRVPLAAQVVKTNREAPPDLINILVEERSGDRPFRHIDDIISQDELRAISDNYKRIAGFSLDALKA